MHIVVGDDQLFGVERFRLHAARRQPVDLGDERVEVDLVRLERDLAVRAVDGDFRRGNALTECIRHRLIGLEPDLRVRAVKVDLRLGNPAVCLLQLALAGLEFQRRLSRVHLFVLLVALLLDLLLGRAQLDILGLHEDRLCVHLDRFGVELNQRRILDDFIVRARTSSARCDFRSGKRGDRL